MNFEIDLNHTCCDVSPIEDLFIISVKKYFKAYKNYHIFYTFQNLQTPTINSMVFSHDGKFLYTGGADGSIWKWDLDIKKKRGVLSPHKYKVQTLSISTSGDYLYSGSKMIKIYDLKKLKLLKEFKFHKDEVYLKIIDSGDIGKIIILSKCENEDYLRGYTYNYKEEYIIYSCKLPNITSFHYNPFKKQIYICDNKGFLEIMNSEWIEIFKMRFGKSDLLIGSHNDIIIVYSRNNHLYFIKDFKCYFKYEIPDLYYKNMIVSRENIYLECEDNVSVFSFYPPSSDRFLSIIKNNWFCDMHFFYF